MSLLHIAFTDYSQISCIITLHLTVRVDHTPVCPPHRQACSQCSAVPSLEWGEQCSAVQYKAYRPLRHVAHHRPLACRAHCTTTQDTTPTPAGVVRYVGAGEPEQLHLPRLVQAEVELAVEYGVVAQTAQGQL